MTCLRCNHGIAKRFGTYGRRKIQRFRCKSCSATFSLPQYKPLEHHTIEFERAVQIVSLLMEGMSIRSISRITGTHKTTILSLLITVGHKCQRLLDNKVRNICPKYVEADELHTFVHTKEKHLSAHDPEEWGDTYTWIAIDSDSKLMISHYVGKRDVASAFEFMRDFSERVTGRFQLTTDAFGGYPAAVDGYFANDIDYAQLVKVYGKPDDSGPEWYGPPRVIETKPRIICGHVNRKRISTSYVERGNLSIRTSLRRFTRLSLGFSKKLENLRATFALYVAWFNFCRVHMSLRVTPAMEAGIVGHVWTIEELLLAA